MELGPRESDFQVGLERLKAFVATECHAKPPDGFMDETGYPVGSWVNSRRQDYKKGWLSAETVATLEALPGWRWNPGATRFEEGLARLKDFIAREGHAKVPAGFRDETGVQLGVWVANRRTDYKKGELAADKVAELEALPGWSWEPRADRFEVGLAHLKEFVNRELHARVPATYVDQTGFRLGTWVDARRQLFKKGKLSPDKIAELEAIQGWVWRARGSE